jgi:catechol 2,3-dioxygenase-like lactoylglutathione lyase family enzyme
MPRLDHLSLPVRDWRGSRDWYKSHLGFEVEFEIPDRKTAAMRDDTDLTIFLYPDGYRLRLWDQKSMQEKGGG